MKINFEIKGQRLTLNSREVNDLLKGLEYALGGGNGAKTFGAVTVSGAAAQGAGGSQFFSGDYKKTDF